jgi:ubiquinone/menaquinone biosynthesis C-methylase UbiE
MLKTGDAYKDEVQRQWDRDACGSQYADETMEGSLEWYLQVENHRYGSYAPWMHKVMEFGLHGNEKVLEIGAGLGTDLAQFAKGGALVTDLDLSSGHLEKARKNFELRGLQGEFHHGDGEHLPFADNQFDVIYTNGVIHHTPNTNYVIDEIWRVLRPGGKAIVMVYAENSLHYWGVLFGEIGIRRQELETASMGEIMSRHVELSAHGSKPLVKVYTARQLRRMFNRFTAVHICKRQLTREEQPRWLRWLPLELTGRLMGWNLIVKATKPK